MRRGSGVFVFMALVLIVAAVPAFGQTTSSVSGVVTSGGNPLPGVTVTVSSPVLQGTRTAVTGDSGAYNIPALPPGNYKVTFELTGMTTVTRNVVLQLSQTTTANADLAVSAVAEAITVTASAPAVLETSGVTTSFTQELVSKLPIGRNIRDTTLLAPGVNPNGVNRQITINGGPSYDNIFMVNGVVVNENLRGQPHNLFIEDAIQETSVMTTGISAEFGRFTGGVVTTLTKSGGNEFTGSFRDSLTNPKWTEVPDHPGAPEPVDRTNQVYEATLGGRIIRDRLWFFGAGRKAKTSVARSTFQTGIGYTNGFDEKRYEGKLTAQITAKHNLIGSYLDVDNIELNNAFLPIYDEASIVPDRSLPNTLESVVYNGVLTNNFVVEAQWSRKEFAFINSGSRFTDRIKGTWISDQVTGARMNSPVFCGVCTPEERNSGGIGAKGTYFLSTRSLGNHSITFGADRFEEERIVNNNQSGSQFQISARVIVQGPQVFPRFDNTTQINWHPIFVLSEGTDLSSDAYFINDRWDFNNHFSFNLGVRYDKNNGVDADGETISDDSNFSPRLGVNYDVRGDGRHRVTASFARYATKIGDGSNVFSTAQAAGSPGTFTWRYRGPAVNPAGAATLVPADQALAILWAWFDSIGATNNTSELIGSSYPGFNSIFLDSLKTPIADELTLGYGMQIGPRAHLRIDGVRREWKNFYARRVNEPGKVMTPPNNVLQDLSITVNDNDFTERTYDAITLQGQWNWSKLLVGGNYTWSHLQGNDIGEGGGTATIRNTPGQIFYPEFLNYPNFNPTGDLPQDRTHRARIWATYDFNTPIGAFSLSAIESYDSGFAYSAVGLIDATGRNANFAACSATVTTNCFNRAANPGYNFSAAGTQHNYFFSDRGEFRTDSRLATDLALSYSLPLFGRFEFFARGDVLNVFNEQSIVDPANLNTDILTSRSAGLSSGLKPFNPFTETPVEGVHWRKGPNFGKANSADAYQVADRSLAPRTYRFGVGLRF